MSAITIPNGAQSATSVQKSAEDVTSQHVNVSSLADLLLCVASKPSKQNPMLRSTANKIVAFLGRPMNEIALDLIHANRETFRPFLVNQRHKETAVRSYVNYLGTLMDIAHEFGWRPFAHLSREWQEVLDLAKKQGCTVIVKSLAQTKDSPANVTQLDIDRWIHLSVQQGTRYSSAQTRANATWRILVSCGFTKHAPISFVRKKKFGIPLSKFPSPLKEQITEILRWKTVEYEETRPNKARIRPISAKSLLKTITSLYGFATRIGGFDQITTLEELIQKPVVGAYISWQLNVQRVKGAPLVTRLASLLAAVSKHPAHKTLDVSWYVPLLDTIPIETKEQLRERKARKYLPYHILEAIPQKLEVQRNSEAKKGELYLARIAQEALNRVASCPAVAPGELAGLQGGRRSPEPV